MFVKKKVRCIKRYANRKIYVYYQSDIFFTK